MKPRKQVLTVIVTVFALALSPLSMAAAPPAGEEATPSIDWVDWILGYLTSRVDSPASTARDSASSWLPPSCPAACPPPNSGGEPQESADDDEDDPAPQVDPTG